MIRSLRILIDNFNSMPIGDFGVFLWHALFKSEKILIYRSNVVSGLGGAEGRSGSENLGMGTLAELVRLRSQRQHVPWEFQCDRYDGVRDFVVYRSDRDIGHISWVYRRGDPNRILKLQEDECEIKFCLTLKEYRGKGIYPAALRAVLGHVAEHGARHCFICVRDDNAASIRGIEKAGFRLAGQTTLRKAFGILLTRPRETSHL